MISSALGYSEGGLGSISRFADSCGLWINSQFPKSVAVAQLEYLRCLGGHASLGQALLIAHEVYQKQKRKGKDIPYITHPLIVGLILARAGASENAIVAGILHDTMEDSVPEKKVTKETIAERFGNRVADIVESVTEPNKELSWEERKEEAYHHIAGMAHESLLVKSADLISNISEMITDHKAEGDETFARFDAPLEKIVAHYMRMIDAIGKEWPGNPLNEDLQSSKLAPMFARML